MKNLQSKIHNPKPNQGFTLIELMVSVSIFVVVMTISMGSILTIFDANKKSQTLRTVMDNLNFSLEAMTRTIRFGTNYHCGSGVPLSSPLDCQNNGIGENSITVIASNGDQVTYKLVGTRILRDIYPQLGSISLNYPITSSDVTITDLKFRVYGSVPYDPTYDLFQPQAIITVSGIAGVKATTRSSFSLETTVSQRLFDSQ
jgi:prepilin-type N-terminal cleavage/methylation domain-containing protein